MFKRKPYYPRFEPGNDPGFVIDPELFKDLDPGFVKEPELFKDPDPGFVKEPEFSSQQRLTLACLPFCQYDDKRKL